ncbi:MAG: response regulator [Bacteroidota bacterium]
MKDTSDRVKKFSFSVRKSLGFRLAIWFFMVSILPLIIIPVVGTVITMKTTHEAARNMLTFSFNQQRQQLSGYFTGMANYTLTQAQLDFPITLAKEINASCEKAKKPFEAFIRTSEYNEITSSYDAAFRKIADAGGVYDVLLISPSGQVLFTLKKETDLGRNLEQGDLKHSLLGNTYLKSSSEKKLYMSSVGNYLISKKSTFFFIVCPLEDEKSTYGYFAFQVSSDSLNSLLESENRLGSSATAYLVDNDCSILASSDPDLEGCIPGTRTSNPEVRRSIALMNSTNAGKSLSNGISVYRNALKSEVLGASMPLPELVRYGMNYVFVQEISADEAYGASSLIIIVMLPLVGFILIFVIVSAFLLIRRIVKPINKLSVWAGAVAEGDLSYMEIKTNEDEIGKVKYGFASVVDSFRQLAEVSEAMAIGDFDSSVAVRGPDDRLGKSVNGMLESFKSVVAEATRISKGDYSGDVQPRSEKDSLGKALRLMTSTLRENSASMQSQDWLKSGMAQLSLKLSGDKPIQVITHDLIKFLVTYLDCQLGLFYLSDDQEDLLLTATYAFNDRKGNFSRLKPGEGLAGQAALEKEIIIFRDIRDNAPVLNVSVDERIPANFLIAPLVFEGKTIGVFQLGKVDEFSELQRKFIEQVREPVAISLNTSTSRQKVRQLLEQTQQQAERLQVQQEELRQTNEELEEQTKALRSSEEALQAQQEELRVINEELQERTKALEEQRDDIRKKNTALTTARNEIEEKAKELEIASKYKSEFLANMSHELRTPLNSIIVLSQLLSENKVQNLTPKQIEYASTINTSGNDLLDLINEILDLSKIEAGRIELHPEAVNLKEILRQMEMFFKPVVEKKGLNFSLHIDEDVPETIFVDNQRLQQILKNLMSNALKFTEKGSVQLDVRRPLSADDITWTGLKPSSSLAFTVIDTGVGIPKDKLKIIFDAFQQADGTTSRRFGGTGLGLTISRSFAQVMGGDIHLVSEEGKGSMFTLLLPDYFNTEQNQPEISKQLEQKAVPADNEQKPGLSKAMANENPGNDDRDVIQKGDKVLLIIEDDASFSRILFDFAKEKGYKCLLASDGETGLYLADLNVPSAIVLDIGLPGIDGWEVMERLRKQAKTRHIPVHFISAMDKSKEALKLGAIGYLTKPVSIDKLRDAFGRIEDVISRPMKKLLVVDDDLVIQKSIINLIGNGDVTTTAVKTGSEAFSLLLKETFDCLILDLGLEDMSGYDLLEKIRTNPKLARLPVIIYTGSELTKEDEEKLQKFADSIIIKGIRSPERLLAETSLFLHRVEANLPKEKQEMIRMLYSQEDVFNDRTILVVDDDPRNVFAITSVLEEKGLKVISAANGREGIEKLKNHNEINLVLMDVMMPEMDGYEAIGLIRQMKKFQNLPIIALTAKAMKEDRDNCIEAGANDYLSKPVDSQKLLSLLRVWLYK